MPHKNLSDRRHYQKWYQQNWRTRNREKHQEIQSKADEKRRGTPSRKKTISEISKRAHHRNKVKVLELYGKKCAFCPESRYEVLCVDHIHSNGFEHRKTKEFKRFARGGMWGFLAKTEFRPDLYRILCHNCNAAKEYYGIEPDGDDYKTIEWWKEFSKSKRLPKVQLGLNFISELE